MRTRRFKVIALFCLVLSCAPAAISSEWEPISEAEKGLTKNPIDPGVGAIVLFKRGNISVREVTSGFWQTQIETYERIKILNEAGREAGNVSFEATKNRRLSKIEGRTILPSGKIVPLDTTQVHRGRVYESGKHFAILKTSFAFPSVEPGAILEYQTVENIDSFFVVPWIFDEYRLATLHSTLTVTVGPRLAMAQFPLDTTRTKIKSRQSRVAMGTQFDYEVDNLFPVRAEPYALPFRDQAATLLFNPFELSFSGNVYPIIKKWEDVGTVSNNWYRETLKKSNGTRDKAKEIAAKFPDPRKRAEAIYQFIQQNIASSEVRGVGLNRPMDDVLQAKHGDSDEINALFVTMLREAKIDADPVLIAAKNYQMLAGPFPNITQFSGLITRVSLKDGTVMADPSDAGAPFGVLPWFEQGIHGVVMKSGKLEDAPTPEASFEQNLTETKFISEVKPGWDIEADVEISMTGAPAAEWRSDLLAEPPEKLDQRLVDYFSLGLPEGQARDIVHPDFKDTSQPFVIKARHRHKMVDEAGPGEHFLNPWIGDRYSSPVFKSTERYSSVRFDYAEKRSSTSVWRLQAGVRVAQLPKEVHLTSDIGEFSHSCTQQDGTVTCSRTFILKKVALPGIADYLNAKKFFEDVARADQEVMVLDEK